LPFLDLSKEDFGRANLNTVLEAVLARAEDYLGVKASQMLSLSHHNLK
jgi:hypothetical protein